MTGRFWSIFLRLSVIFLSMAAECDSGLDGPASDGGDAGTFAFPNVAATFLATFFATGAGATAFLAIAFFAGTTWR